MIEDHAFFTGTNIILAWSVYIILLSGSLSFANGAFMAMGGYGAGVLTVKFGVPLIPASLLAGIATGIAGALLAYPALRTRGVYLIMVTVGITFVVQVSVQNIDYIGGVRGMTGMSGTTLFHVYGLIVLIGVALFWLSRSHLQRLLDATREDEQVAQSIGINTLYLKIACFGAGAALAAVAGAFYAHHMTFISPDNFSIYTSIYVVLYVILGGINNMWGPVIGATLLTLLPEFSRILADWRPLVFGLAIIVILLVRPDGLLSFRIITARGGAARNDSRKPTISRPGQIG